MPEPCSTATVLSHDLLDFFVEHPTDFLALAPHLETNTARRFERQIEAYRQMRAIFNSPIPAACPEEQWKLRRIK